MLQRRIGWMVAGLSIFLAPLSALAAEGPKKGSGEWSMESVKAKVEAIERGEGSVKFTSESDLVKAKREGSVLVPVSEGEKVKSENVEQPELSKGVVRIALRKWRRELILKGELQKAATITRLLWNRQALEAFEDFAVAEMASQHPEGVPGDWVDQLTILFQWLIDHSDEIIELILKIIDLFAYYDAQGYTNLYAVLDINPATGQMNATVYGTPPVVMAA